MEAQAIFLNLNSFAHRANRGLFFVRLLTKKQMEVVRLQTDKTDLPIYGEDIPSENSTDLHNE
jgi:hypothetical protein